MVCDKCQKKLGKVIVPDKWKSGARNTTESGGRSHKETNAILSKKKELRFDPLKSRCRICKGLMHQPGQHYCNTCAYKKDSKTDLKCMYMCDIATGICSMCGKKVSNISNQRQSTK